MTEELEPLSPALRDALQGLRARRRALEPSAALAARIEASIGSGVDAAHAPRSVPMRRRPLIAYGAAASVVLLVVLLAPWQAWRGAPQATAGSAAPADGPASGALPAPAVASGADAGVAAMSQATSPWPGDSWVVRVAAVDTAAGLVLDPGTRVAAEYWVDVRIASDGATEILRVIPASAADRIASSGESAS